MQAEQQPLEIKEDSHVDGRGKSPGSRSAQFKPGHKPISRNAEESNALSLMETMRRIVQCNPVANNTATRALRKEFKESPTKFIARVEAMEKAAAAEAVRAKAATGGASETGAGTPAADETEEKLLGLIEQLRGEYQGRKT